MSTVLIFAGGDPVSQTLREELPESVLVIAADSGHDTARSLEVDVDVIIGDFDSLSPAFPVAEATRLIDFPANKDATDLELALEFAIEHQPGRIVVVGAEGGRFDHELSALAVITSPRWAAVPEIEWVRSDSHIYVVRNTIRIQGDHGGFISLLAMGGDAVGVTTSGLVWSLDDEVLHHGSSRGTSNQFKSPEATIRVREGTVLAVVPAVF